MLFTEISAIFVKILLKK